LVTKTTDEFVDKLQGKPAHEQKQLLGEKLYDPRHLFIRSISSHYIGIGSKSSGYGFHSWS
jgi:hypothetical protein